MGWIEIIGAVLSGGIIATITRFLIDRKKTDQDGFQILFNELKEDNERLRTRERENETMIRELQKRVDDLHLKLQLMESAHYDLPIPQWLKDTHGRMLSINQPFTEVFGKTSEEYVGYTDWEVWDEATARQFVTNDREVIRTRKSVQTVDAIPMPSGNVERWYVLKYPRYAGKTVVGIGGIAFKKVPEYAQTE